MTANTEFDRKHDREGMNGKALPEETKKFDQEFLQGMQVGQRVSANKDLTVDRVPGGWLYTCMRVAQAPGSPPAIVMTSTLVPE